MSCTYHHCSKRPSDYFMKPKPITPSPVTWKLWNVVDPGASRVRYTPCTASITTRVNRLPDRERLQYNIERRNRYIMCR